jgi:hypothetical protein
VIWLFLQDDLHQPLDPLFNQALKREIDKIAAGLPHDQIAIQFDVASAVFARLQRNEPNAYGKNRDEMLASFGRILSDLANHVPADIELLFHFCYGDSNHKHVIEPTDMNDMVDVANQLTRDVTRPINLIHMPVPRDRADDGYFAPLARLKLKPETEPASGWCTTPTVSTARGRGSRWPSGTPRIFRSRPNAALAAAIRRRSLNCCEFTGNAPVRPLAWRPGFIHYLRSSDLRFPADRRGP